MGAGLASLAVALTSPGCRSDEAEEPAALTAAAEKGLIDRVEQLLDAGVDPEERGRFGLRPVDAARAARFPEVAGLLEARGADGRRRPPEEVASEMISSVLPSDAPGFAILVARDGEVLLSRGFGLADRGRSTAVSPATRFPIGSISKPMTATAILMLQQDGKLRISDPLSTHLPDYPRADELTLHQLLTHTSGLHNFTDKSDFRTRIVEPGDRQTVIDSFRADPHVFEPGRQYRYSNSAYLLLAEVIERVSGLPYPAFLAERIFEPLGMEATFAHVVGGETVDLARGYAWTGHSVEEALDWNLARVEGAGSVLSTSEDLARFVDAYFRGGLLSAESRAMALSPPTLSSGQRSNYGCGWVLSHRHGSRVAEHSGGLDGFWTIVQHWEEPRLTVVVLHNAAPPVIHPSFLAERLASLFLVDDREPRAAMRRDRDASPDTFDALVGHYRIDDARVQVVSRQGTRLYSQVTDQDRFEIVPRAPDHFFFEVVDAQLHFLRDEAGRVTAVRHFQGGGELTAPRIAEPD